MFPTHPAQDRQKTERYATLVVSIVHVVQNDVIKFADLAANSIQRLHFKATSIRGQGSIRCRKNCRALEFITQLRGQGERVIADSVDSTRHTGNDLKNGFQHSGKETN